MSYPINPYANMSSKIASIGAGSTYEQDEVESNRLGGMKFKVPNMNHAAIAQIETQRMLQEQKKQAGLTPQLEHFIREIVREELNNAR